MNSKTCCNIPKVLCCRGGLYLKGPDSKHKNEAPNSRGTKDLYEELSPFEELILGAIQELSHGLWRGERKMKEHGKQLAPWGKAVGTMGKRKSHCLWLDGFCCFLLQIEKHRSDATGTNRQ